MKKIKELLWPVRYPILSIIIGIVVGLITGNAIIGFIVVFGLFALLIGYTWIRQLWWWITKTGDYED